MGEAAPRRLTYAEYLALEETSAEKHHFADGVVYAMGGGSIAHSLLQTRLVVRLGTGLEGGPCVPHGSELRIHLPHLDEACYADALVVCGPVEVAELDPNAATNPTVVFEVLSPSTEAYDRGRKFEKYRGLRSLVEYVLLAQDRAFVEVYRREPDGAWRLHEHRAGAEVVLASVGLRLSVDDLYRGVLASQAAPGSPPGT